ncbi:MAG: ATP-binding cassette domain-containing protein [Paenacidovorax caeni]
MHDLAFAYPGCPLWAHWSHAWGPGVALVRGGDGAGKTTLLRLLAGQLAPTQGRLLLQGVDAAAQPEAYRRQVFWIDPRLPGLPAHDGQTPAQWLQSLPAHYPQWSDAALQAHVQGWSLAQHLDKPFHALSSGTQRKIFKAAPRQWRAADAHRRAHCRADKPLHSVPAAGAGTVRRCTGAAGAGGALREPARCPGCGGRCAAVSV